MNILLVEDHRLFADALQVLLKDIEEEEPTPSQPAESHPKLQSEAQVFACYSTQQALSLLDGGKHVDLIIADLFMPGIDGLGLLDALQNRSNRVPVVIVSGTNNAKYIQQAKDKGASGFMCKTIPGSEMLLGLKMVLQGKSYFPKNGDGSNQVSHIYPPRAVKAPSEQPPPKLSKRQLQVLKLVAAGNTNRQISDIVGTSEATIKYHVTQLFKLFAVQNRTACVKEAVQCGLLASYDAS